MSHRAFEGLRRSELATALKVIRAFKETETPQEWAFTPFLCWQKLEELETALVAETMTAAERGTAETLSNFRARGITT